MSRLLAVGAAVVVILLAPCGSGTADSASSVDFGAISHQGLKSLGPASHGMKLDLELGLIANQRRPGLRPEVRDRRSRTSAA